MDRKRGSILIKTISAIFITAISIILSGRLYIFVSRNIEKQDMKYRDLESLNAVSNEVKYNIKFDVLKDKLKNGNIILKYDNDFLERLTKEEVLDLKSDYRDKKRIEISLIDVNRNSFNIKIILYSDSKEIEEVIEKGLWMDYV